MNPVTSAATTGACAVLALVMGGLVHGVVVLGGAGAVLVLLRRQPRRTATID